MLVAFASSAGGVFLVKRIATRLNVIDTPALPKKTHALPTPLWGGVAPLVIFSCLIVGVEYATGFFSAGTVARETVWGLACALVVLILGGMWDDKTPLPPKMTFFFPVLASGIAVAFGMGVSKVTNPFGDPFILLPATSLVITCAWLLCVTYTTKLLDGVDGLVTGVGMVGAGMIAALALTVRWYQPDSALLALLFFAVLAGFFVWNTAPARIFLGEAGSTGIGFVLGALSVMGGSKFATLLLVVGLPALDVAFVIVRRLQQHRSPFHGGDGLHFHTILQKRGWSARQIVALYMGMSLLFGIASLFLTAWQKLFALALLALLALGSMLYASRSVRL